MKNIIGSGAEAIIYMDNGSVVKDRIKKSYRISEIDEKLRKLRTRSEGKILNRLNELGFPSPSVKEFCDKSMKLKMSLIKGEKVRDILTAENAPKLATEIGKKIAVLHNHNIIHSDLTTSNMIIDNNNLHLIDFGLSFFSHKIEDKAVDLHLLKQGLESKHHTLWETAFEDILDAYSKNCSNSDDILKRLAKVEERGRYKRK